MERTRQRIPEGLAEMPPGPGLAAVLSGVDLRRLTGADCVAVLRARHRQASHEQARLMAAMVEVGLCGIGPDEQLPRMETPDEFSADEIRGALSWTLSTANAQLSLAWDLIHRLPQVFAALDAGSIDVPKTKVFSEWTSGLTDTQAHEICDRLLPEAPGLTTGQLTDRVKKMAIAIDPDWARRRYEEAVRDRKVVGYRNEDGTGNLGGYNLPADQVAAACAHIDALAKKVKAAGDSRPADHIKADLYVAMLDGSYIGWSEADIVAHMLTVAEEQRADSGCAAEHNVVRPFRRPGGHRETDREGRTEAAARPRPHSDTPYDAEPGEPNQADSTTANPGAGNPGPNDQDDDRRSDRQAIPGQAIPGQVIEGPWTSRPQRTPPPPARRTGVEIRAEITVLLGLNDHPAEIPGWGFINAESARRLVREQTAAEWRYAITDEQGHLLYEGITRRRPVGFPSRAEAACRGGIVELQILLPVLRRMAAFPGRAGGWAQVIADLARQADQHEAEQRDGSPAADERGGRSPGKPMRRRTQIRDRTCTHPRCRVPAHSTDGDHIHEWARGGLTRDDNIGSACRHDHRLRHEGGWTVVQPLPGYFIWTSRLGIRYHARPQLIIEPLPDPIPRDPPLFAAAAGGADPPDYDTPTWREPERPEPPAASPPDHDYEIPPF